MDFLPKTLLDTSLELMSVNEEGVRSKTLGLGEETLIGGGNLGRASFFGPFLARPFNLASLNEIEGEKVPRHEDYDEREPGWDASSKPDGSA